MPVLHYIRMISLQHGYDVLSLQYGFQVAGTAPKHGDDVLREARRAVVTTLTRGYREVCFVGKSMGSPPRLLVWTKAVGTIE